MLERLEQDPKLFAIGWLRQVDLNGIAFPNQPNAKQRGVGVRYIHPYASLIDRSIYNKLRPFANKGAPAIHLMTDAAAKGYRVEQFDLSSFISHKIAGTRGLYGGAWLVPNGTKPGRWSPQGI